MKAFSSTVFLVIALTCSAQFGYPESREVDSSFIYHKTKVNDPFQWMENLNSSEVIAWSKEQEEVLSKYLDNSSTKERIKTRLTELVALDLYSTPTKKNGKYYYSKYSKEDGVPKIYYQKDINAEEVLLINPSENADDYRLAMNGNSSGFTISEKGKLLAYNLSKNNQRWFEVQLYDLQGSEKLEKLKGFHSTGGGPIWFKDDGFFYNRYQEPNDDEKLTSKVGSSSVYYHKIGTEQSEDNLILANDFLGEGWYYSISVSDDNKFFAIGARKGSSTSNKIFIKEIGSNGSFKELFADYESRFLYLGNDNKNFFFYTDLDAPNGRIIKTSINDKEYQIVEVISETDETMSANSLVGGNALGFFNDRFVIKYTKNGQPLIKVFDKSGKHLYTPVLPLGGSVWGGFKGDSSSNEVFYQFLGLIDPSSIYKLDLNTGKIEIFKRSIGLQQDDFLVEKVSVPGENNVEIPMYVARKKSTKLNGNNPGFIYGYGAFGWVSFIWYQPHILLWLEMGGVYAIPGIRGGGELGAEWHEAGRAQSKQNSIDDYIAASEWLINSKYVAKDKLVANGGSISAIVAGAALNQRPNLYGAAIIDRPALDLLRFPEFTGAKAWIQELGSPDKKEEFEAIYKYSPYHNLENKCYPPTLVMIGDKDETTSPLHAFKYVASLQKKNTCMSNPVMLKIMKDVGHNFGNTDDQKVDSFTDMMYFLFKNLNVGYQ